MPIAEYFVLPGGKIPTFEEDALFPFMKGDGKRYNGVHLAPGPSSSFTITRSARGFPAGSAARARR